MNYTDNAHESIATALENVWNLIQSMNLDDTKKDARESLRKVADSLQKQYLEVENLRRQGLI